MHRLFFFYGSYLTYQSYKSKFFIKLYAILQYMENKKIFNKKCLSFYNDFNRGGFMLDRFLSGYSSYLFTIRN